MFTAHRGKLGAVWGGDGRGGDPKRADSTLGVRHPRWNKIGNVIRIVLCGWSLEEERLYSGSGKSNVL